MPAVKKVPRALDNRDTAAHVVHVHGHHFRLLDRLDDGGLLAITRWNRPPVSSPSGELASRWRNRLFGVMTTRGLRSRRSICRRIMWNICAGVDGTQT